MEPYTIITRTQGEPKYQSDNLIQLKADRGKSMIVGKGHPDQGGWHGSMNIGELIDSAQKDGDFSNQIAKSFICSIYSLWDEFYRHNIAAENNCGQKQVASNLMGDIRHIRNCIVHKKSIITNEQEKIKEINWLLIPGELVISEEMFQILIDQINHMTVTISPNL